MLIFSFVLLVLAFIGLGLVLMGADRNDEVLGHIGLTISVVVAILSILNLVALVFY